MAPPSAQPPQQVEIDESGRVQLIALDRIVPSPFQPRRVFDEAALGRLADSIRTAGVMQPVLVRAASGSSGGGMYELVAGERRWRAAKLAGLNKVPAIVSSLSDSEAAEFSLIENIQREDLNTMERAWALRALAERFALTHDAIASKVGLERPTVSNLIRLTELEPAITNLIGQGRLSMGHGKALLGLPPGESRIAAAARAADAGWSVRRMENEVAAASKGPRPDRESTRAASAARDDLERQLGDFLGTKVHLNTNKGGTRGELVIEFFNLDHFDAIMAKLNFQPR